MLYPIVHGWYDSVVQVPSCNWYLTGPYGGMYSITEVEASLYISGQASPVSWLPLF